jgi:hypothetical protein
MRYITQESVKLPQFQHKQNFVTLLSVYLPRIKLHCLNLLKTSTEHVLFYLI